MLSCVGGVVTALITGWPAAGPIMALAIWGLPGLFGQTSGSVSIVKDRIHCHVDGDAAEHPCCHLLA